MEKPKPNCSLNSQRLKLAEKSSTQVAALQKIVEGTITVGFFDYVLKVVVKNPEAFNDLILKLPDNPNISKVQSSSIMSYTKQSASLHF
ncbi:Lrp/AsnC ligand binding domain-containing protein [Flavobacterium sp. N2038]|uniref:Lrp/AsnC ligand binding domain-containing protein n=1 Tax=Flavobacterium sp. N2038 TaxID=2986829 RepID=UPI0039B5A849